MFEPKYFDGIRRAQNAQPPASELPAFDLYRLSSGGLVGRLLGSLHEDPRWLLALCRRFMPFLQFGRFLLVSRSLHVREVLERESDFETPYGPEMAEIAAGPTFILGLQDGPAYRRLKSLVLAAFPPDEVEAAVKPLAARHAAAIMDSADAKGFDAVHDLLRVVPLRICREYFGLVIADEAAFGDWAIALSALFFSDPTGSPATRELARVAGARLGDLIAESAEAARNRRTPCETPVARLAAMVDDGRLSPDEMRAVLLGMIAGFAPTNLLASGNCLDVILARPEARAALERACAAGDDSAIDRVILEAMRFKPIWIGPWRYAPRDTVIARGSRWERVVKAGTVVIPATLSAMFDADTVPDPNHFRPDRSARDSLVFGHGIHLCVGAALARVQIRECLRALFAMPGLRRAKGRAGRLARLGAYPESLTLRFDPHPLCRVVEHAMVTVVCPVRSDVSLAEVRRDVERLGNPAIASVRTALDEAGIFHFASLAVVGTDRNEQGRETGVLLLELSVDGTESEALVAFARHAGSVMGPIFAEHGGPLPKEDLAAFLRRHSIAVSPRFGGHSGLVFSGTPGHSVARIHAEARLERMAREIVEAPRPSGAVDAAGLLREVRRRIGQENGHGWALQAAESRLDQGPGSAWRAVKTTVLAPWVLLTLTVVVALCTAATFKLVFDPVGGPWRNPLVLGAALVLALAGLLLAASTVLGLAFLALRRLEKGDVASDEAVSIRQIEAVMERENRSAQNHLTAVSIMKPGLLRRLVLRLAFYLISIAAREVFRPGYLASLNTIHFARWVRLPGTDRLVFLSNYGGSWDSYLEDFIAKAAAGLTGVWSNTAGFPRTRWLFGQGARDGERFKRWARRQQVPTLFWYSAYGENTGRIRINSAVRRGIASASDCEARDWLRLFGSAPLRRAVPGEQAEVTVPTASSAPETLESGEIQTIVFSGMGSLGHAQMLAVGIPEDALRPSMKAWLAFIASRVSFGDRVPAGRAMLAAFGPNGLARLGLGAEGGDDPLDTFPVAFRQGLGSAARARILDNGGADGPDTWRWGAARTPVDVLLVAFAESAGMLEDDLNNIRERTAAAGLRMVAELPLVLKREAGRPARDQFGFADGVSQPIIKGTRRAFAAPSPDHLIRAGEFVLGYCDEHGFLPASPSVAAGRDPSGMLAPAADAQTMRRRRDARRDFGRNGTFLVARQFAQHVETFERFCRAAAATASAEAGEPISRDWIAAKMIGRWPDGTSLVRNPEGRPGRGIDNDFRFGAEDPHGLACPLGAHVRRVNPRDSLGEDHETQIRINKRHRILRVGRTYEEPARDGREAEKGLLFMCLNADIERQYEFVQQSWTSSPSFHGLQREKDPLIGARGDTDRFTIPRWEGAVVLKGLPDFVATRGGGYFFVPGRAALHFMHASL
ncbi:MAG TPA: cytochrome P450 [Mesorhizobium sp.]|jgi:Dyp-type peroxidase family|nr:cytochrome P450 [Mesorhizobium sp.]